MQNLGTISLSVHHSTSIMAGTNLFILLIGTTIASSHVLRNAIPAQGGFKFIPNTKSVPISWRNSPFLISPASGLPQFIPHLLPGGGNIIYKPQFLIPHQNLVGNIDCEKDEQQYLTPVNPDGVNEQFLSEEPAPIIENVENKPLDTPEPPQLPTLPEIIHPVLPLQPENHNEHDVETNSIIPVEIPKPPVLPPFVMPEIPLVVHEPVSSEPDSHNNPEILENLNPDIPENLKPSDIPEPPVLPPFVMPEIPVIEQDPVPSTPVPSGKPFINTNPIVPENVFKPAYIPEPPVLPPFVMPEIPLIIQDPLPSEPEIHNNPENNVKPAEIPEPPMLPPLVMPEIPAIAQEPAPIVNEIYDEPHINTNSLAPEVISKPAEIPEPPVLPPFVMPEIPLVVQEKVPYLPEIPKNPEILTNPILPEIPEPPVLPPIVMPVIPEIVVDEPKTPIHEISNIPQEQAKPVVPEVSSSSILPSPPEGPIIQYVVPDFQPIAIPEAPVLPPFTMPTLPEFTIEEKKPEPTINDITSEPERESNPASFPDSVEEGKPFEIPPPPELPPFPFPASMDINQPIEEPKDISMAPITKPQEIPVVIHQEKPQLPESPVFVLQPAQQTAQEPCDDYDNRVPGSGPTLILEEVTPVLGTTIQQAVPQFVEHNIAGDKVMIPSLGALSFPNYCVQNIIIDRALPNMILSEKDYSRNAGQYSIWPMTGYYKK